MHQMTPNWAWTLNRQKYYIYIKYLPLRAQIWVRFALRQTISEIQGHQKSEQEAQGLGALLDKMEDNDHIKLGNIEI